MDMLLLPLNSCDYWFDSYWPWVFEFHFLRMLPIYLIQMRYSLRPLTACWIGQIYDPVFSLFWWASESDIGLCHEITPPPPMMCSVVPHPIWIMFPACCGAWRFMRWDGLTITQFDLTRRCSVGTIPVSNHVKPMGTCLLCLGASQGPSLLSCVICHANLNASVLWVCQLQLSSWWLLPPWSIWTKTPTSAVVNSL